MYSFKEVLVVMLSVALGVCCTSSAYADLDPNDNYSTLVLSFKNSNFAEPICVGQECHEGVSGPAAVFSHQFVPNLALGLTGSYLQSTASESRI